MPIINHYLHIYICINIYICIYITTKTYQVPCCFNVESYPYTFSDTWGIYRYTMYVSYMDDAWHCRNKVADSGWFHLRCVSILLCPRPVSALHQSHDPFKVGIHLRSGRKWLGAEAKTNLKILNKVRNANRANRSRVVQSAGICTRDCTYWNWLGFMASGSRDRHGKLNLI